MDESTLTLEEVAEKLNVSDQTVRRWIAKKGFPGYRPGRRWIFFWSEVMDWVKEQNESDSSDSGNGDTPWSFD